jgi:penicillin-binding protein 1A
MRRREIAWRVLRALNLAVLALAVLIFGIMAGAYSSVAEVIPNFRNLGEIVPNQGTTILSADGKLLARVAVENRDFVPLERIPEALQNAAVGIEDERFYHHQGLDLRGILRAALQNVIHRGIYQGGSTITQQLARNVYLSPERTPARKMQEAVLAIQLERHYSKPEILELYLNQIYFGEGAYGVQVAAETFFGKSDLSKLTLGECALLAGLPKFPAGYSPFNHPERARQRRDAVLAKMAELGFIDARQAARAQAEPLKLARSRPAPFRTHYEAPYFVDYVLRTVRDRYGVAAIYRGGLTIQTTLNLALQHEAERLLTERVRAARGLRVTQGALIALDPNTGAVLAMVGGVSYQSSVFNRVTQARRQPGSAFKVFVYTAAIDQGHRPNEIIMDSPVSYPGGGDSRYVPRNYDGSYMGAITLTRALALSRNVCAVKLAEKVGIQNVIAYAHRMGITQELDPYLSLALGSTAVTPFEMASAFGVLATGGLRAEPYAIAKVLDAGGRVIEIDPPRISRVLREETAATMNDMLAEVIRSGTAAGAVRRAGGLPFPAAGKTGTSSNYKDAWFIGFTSKIVAAVWVGNDDSTPMHKVAGSAIPAPIWAAFMKRAMPLLETAATPPQLPGIQGIPRPVSEPPPDIEGVPSGSVPDTGPAPPVNPDTDVEPAPDPEPPPPPPPPRHTAALAICSESGLLATPYCPHPRIVSFDLDRQQPPSTYCTIHRRAARAAETVTVRVCATTGLLATSYCPRVVNRTFDAGQAPTEHCTLHRPRR